METSIKNVYVYSWIILPSSRDWHNTINQLWKWKSLNPVQLFVTPWTIRPWTTPGQNTGVGSHSLLQRIFPTQESNLGLLHCRQILFRMSYEGSPSYGINMCKQDKGAISIGFNIHFIAWEDWWILSLTCDLCHSWKDFDRLITMLSLLKSSRKLLVL